MAAAPKLQELSHDHKLKATTSPHTRVMSDKQARGTGKSQRDKRKRDSSWKPSALPYKADYNDHFETPETAYRDILPLLDYLSQDRKSHLLYDPFYCNGRTSVLLKGLGFSRVIHDCRDFYKDVDNGTVPAHDTLITNPPYSDDHKERCVSFALEQLRTKGRPFFILMPNYVAARDYYRRILLANPGAGTVYVIPSTPYEYDHPEGTGHAISPFDSIWYCGIGADRVENAEKCWNEYWNDCDHRRVRPPRLVTSLDELERIKAVPTIKRPNPKQRRKRRKQIEAAAASHSSDSVKNDVQKPKSNQKKSRYRNENGERKRKRF